MENELILFETADKEIKLTVPIKNNTVWLNRKQLAELFTLCPLLVYELIYRIILWVRFY